MRLWEFMSHDETMFVYVGAKVLPSSVVSTSIDLCLFPPQLSIAL